jgi:hypothetical protein
MLTTADGTTVVKYFGREREIVIRKKIELLGKSCFESCGQIERVVFEDGSELRRIGPSALSDCKFIVSIAIPAWVERIQESAFKNCDRLKECLMNEETKLTRIGKEAFVDCFFTEIVLHTDEKCEGIGEKCFHGCGTLHRLRFGSGESLAKGVGDGTLDEALGNIEFNWVSSSFRIEVDAAGGDLVFPEWISVADSGSTLILVQADK